MVKLQVVSVNMHFDAILLQCLNKEILAHSSRSDMLPQLRSDNCQALSISLSLNLSLSLRHTGSYKKNEKK